jgi:hypothetical protein
MSAQDRADILDKIITDFNNGDSYVTIAERLRMSKGQVSGAVSRARQEGKITRELMRLKDAGTRSRQKTGWAMPKTTGGDQNAKSRANRQKVEAHKQEVIRTHGITGRASAALEEVQKSGGCKWPIGNIEDADFRFCGGKRLPIDPYCEEHKQIAYIDRPIPEEVMAGWLRK